MPVKLDMGHYKMPDSCLNCPFHDLLFPYTYDNDCECVLMGMLKEGVFMCNEVNVRVERPEWCPLKGEIE